MVLKFNLFKLKSLLDYEGKDEDTDDNPELDYKSIPHPGGVNRIRVRSCGSSSLTNSKVYASRASHCIYLV